MTVTAAPATAPPWLTRREAVAVVLVGLAPVAVFLISTRLAVAPPTHDVVTFLHVGFAIAGFGGVLAVDWMGLSWAFGRGAGLEEVVRCASNLGSLIWLGYAGLLLTGIFLAPDLGTPSVWVKLAGVTGAGIVGVLARGTHHRLTTLRGPLPSGLLVRGAALAATSQLCWWVATVVGFVSTMHRPRG